MTSVGLLVATYLEQAVPDVARAEFTATMEAGLDDVAAGAVTRVEYLTRFWTEGLAPLIRAAGDDFPSLLLPQLEDVRLRASPGGPKLFHAGKSAPLPLEVIPADLTGADVDAIMTGSWAPKKTRAKKDDASAGDISTPAKTRKASKPKTGAKSSRGATA